MNFFIQDILQGIVLLDEAFAGILFRLCRFQIKSARVRHPADVCFCCPSSNGSFSAYR
jgi:hypothetical protein